MRNVSGSWARDAQGVGNAGSSQQSPFFPVEMVSGEEQTHRGHPVQSLLPSPRSSTALPEQSGAWLMLAELLLAHAASSDLCKTSSPAHSALSDPFHLHQEICKGALGGVCPGIGFMCWEMCNRVKPSIGAGVEACLSALWLTHYISLCESKYFFCQNACNTIHSHSFLGVEAKASMILISAGFCAPVSIRNPRTYKAVLQRQLELFLFKVTANVIMPTAHSALH